MVTALSVNIAQGVDQGTRVSWSSSHFRSKTRSVSLLKNTHECLRHDPSSQNVTHLSRAPMMFCISHFRQVRFLVAS